MQAGFALKGTISGNPGGGRAPRLHPAPSAPGASSLNDDVPGADQALKEALENAPTYPPTPCSSSTLLAEQARWPAPAFRGGLKAFPVSGKGYAVTADQRTVPGVLGWTRIRLSC